MSNTINQKRRRAERTREFMEVLAERFPGCFSRDRKAVRPLAIGIQEQLRERLNADPELADTPGWLVKQALARYTRTPAYLEAVIAGRPRIGLDGTDAGEITDSAREHARLQREEQKKRAARKHRERRQSDTPSDEVSRRKLRKLADRFNNR